MIIPEFLKKGDCAGIVATARKITSEEIVPAIEILEKWGLKVKLGKHLFSECNQFAGTDEERLVDLQEMLDDPDVKVIFCARGGYGTVRIIDGLDFTKFKLSPKWVVGFSDVTVLHSHIHQNFGIESLHGIMPWCFSKEMKNSPALQSLQKAIFGENLSYTVPNSEYNKIGASEGILVGGNLSILYSLLGSSSDLDTQNKILFLEDLDEYLYHIDRMMMALKRAGKLKHLGGLLIGGMTDMHDNSIPFGKTVEEIIYDAVAEYSYPVCFNVPAGHFENNNCALFLGREIKISVSLQSSTIHF